MLVASQAHDLETVLLAWLVAGAANSIANVSYESLLQERTPHDFRGRVFAAFQFVTNIAFLSGAFLAGWLGTRFGIRMSYVFSGGLFLLGGILCRMVLVNPRPGKVLLVGFEPGGIHAPLERPDRAFDFEPVEPIAAATPAAEATPVAAEPVSGAPAAFRSSGSSIFSGSESVFAMAERLFGDIPAGLPPAPRARRPPGATTHTAVGSGGRRARAGAYAREPSGGPSHRVPPVVRDQ